MTDNNSLHAKKMKVLFGLDFDQAVLVNKGHIDNSGTPYYTFNKNFCIIKPLSFFLSNVS